MDEKEIPSYSLEGWVARDKYHDHNCNTGIRIFLHEPRRHPLGYPWWQGDPGWEIPHAMFPHLTWLDEPLKVRLEIWKER